MARRSDHSKEELKELAIQCGLELIRAEGFSHFSARKVAGKMGYTVGTLYHLFGTYDDFVLHLNARTLDAWFEATCAHMKAHTKDDPIRTLAQFYIHYSQAHTHEWVALFEYHLHEGKPVPDWYAPKMTRFFTLVEELLQPLVQNHDEAKRAARVLWAGIHGISILSLSGKLDIVGADTAEVLAHSFVEHYMTGLTRGQHIT
jgi:AcrR family transcriptional regulator